MFLETTALDLSAVLSGATVAQADLGEVLDRQALGRLLRGTVRTGAGCCYEPDPSRPVGWVGSK